MTTMDATSPQRLSEQISRLESERPHLATKEDVALLRADMERHTRLLVMWFIATQIALFAALLYFLG